MKQPARALCRAGILAILSLTTTPLRAAQPIISDPLTSWPLNFGGQGSAASLKNGAVHITAPANGASWVTYNGFQFTDMDASVTVTPGNNTGNAMALLFWATGPNDFFEFSVSEENGTFAVYKHVSTATEPWQVIVPFTKADAIKPNVPDTLRVVTKGNSLTLYINGQSLGSLAIMAPSGGGAVGIEGEGSAKGASDYAFTNLTVSQ